MVLIEVVPDVVVQLVVFKRASTSSNNFLPLSPTRLESFTVYSSSAIVTDVGGRLSLLMLKNWCVNCERDKSFHILAAKSI